MGEGGCTSQYEDTSDSVDTIYATLLYPTINTPTQITATSNTLIDNTFYNNFTKKIKAGNIATSISDPLTQNGSNGMKISIY